MSRWFQEFLNGNPYYGDFFITFSSPDELTPEDAVYEGHGVKVVVDPKSLPFIDGSVVDYNDGLTGAGFVIQNPSTTGTCGCGQSFSV